MEDETTQNLYKSIGFLTYVPKIFGKSFENVTAHTRDKLETSQSIKKMKKPLIRYANQRFQPSFGEIISNKKKAVHKVHVLMVKR